MHTRARVDEVVIVEDAMKEVMAKEVSEDVNVDVEVVVDEEWSKMLKMSK